MRKSRQEAAETRRRIVEAAADEFRRKGIASAGLNDLMAAAGLTHGGFYRHFESKDQLVAEACASAADSVIAAVADAIGKKKGERGLKAVAGAYLSKRHRDDPTFGCPFAALGSDLARADGVTKAAATEGLEKLITLLADQCEGDRKAAEGRAIVMLSTMIGALLLSRIASSPDLSAKILKEAEQHLVAA
jgi:TetR/AcrR family transcriptional repressor of nem operon